MKCPCCGYIRLLKMLWYMAASAVTWAICNPPSWIAVKPITSTAQLLLPCQVDAKHHLSLHPWFISACPVGVFWRPPIFLTILNHSTTSLHNSCAFSQSIYQEGPIPKQCWGCIPRDLHTDGGKPWHECSWNRLLGWELLWHRTSKLF